MIVVLCGESEWCAREKRAHLSSLETVETAICMDRGYL